MTRPFLVIGLPRSRTAWLSRFLTYGEWICGHEQARHLRSFDDIDALLSQPFSGSCETVISPFWRLFPDIPLVIIRRDPEEVVDSLMSLPVVFDRDVLLRVMRNLDMKLEQIAKHRDALVVPYSSLNNENTCALVFEYCLGIPHDHDHWESLKDVNVQCDMRALMRYMSANAASLNKLALTAKHKTLAAMTKPAKFDADDMTIQAEDFDTWLHDARDMIEDHLVLVGESPAAWHDKNLDMMRGLHANGNMQIVTARSNGRIFGYLMTLISPSMTGPDKLSAYNMTFRASADAPGVGMKIQRYANALLAERGVHDVFYECGKRGDGPRLNTLYRRLGAVEHGNVYRLELEAA